MNQKKHVLISGTGRSGTSFIMRVLTDLGYDTGFKSRSHGIDRKCNSGMENNCLNPCVKKSGGIIPTIIKDPYACHYLDSVLRERRIEISNIICPMRDAKAAAQSRIDLGKYSGGLWMTDDGSKQEAVLLESFYKLVLGATQYSVPINFLHFPRLALDAEYCYLELKKVFPDLDEQRFCKSHSEISDPSLIHY